jgi:hypothetical protein
MFEIIDLFTKDGEGGGVSGCPFGGISRDLTHGGDVLAQLDVFRLQRSRVAKVGGVIPAGHIRAEHSRPAEDDKEANDRQEIDAKERQKPLLHAVFPLR